MASEFDGLFTSAAPPIQATPAARQPTTPAASGSEFDGLFEVAAPKVRPAVQAGPGVEAFVSQYLPLAQRVSEQTGVAPQALLGQWGLETGWGKSIIPGTHNLGNIKDLTGKGAVAVDNMTKKSDAYQRFDTPDAFGDHYAGLLGRRYRNALDSGDDSQKFFTALKNGGYAQDPNYIQSGVKAANLVGTVLGLDPKTLTTVHGAPGAAGAASAGGYTDTASGARLRPKLGLMETTSEGFKGGFKSSQGLSAQVGALILNTAGVQPALQKSLLEYAEGKNKEVSDATGDVSSFTDAIGSGGDLPRWVANSAGYLGYQVAESILTGGFGALIGKSVGKAAVTTLAHGMVEKEIVAIAATASAKAMTPAEIGAIAAGRVAGKLGAVSTMFANNIRQEGGSIYGDAVEQSHKTGQPVDLARVWGAALAASGVDTAADVFMAKGLLGMKEGSTAASYAGRAAREVPKNMMVQSGTEAVQTGIEQWGAAKPVDWKDIADSSAVGALGGAAGGVGTAMHRRGAAAGINPLATPAADPLVAIEQQRQAGLAPVAAAAAQGGTLSKAAMAAQDSPQVAADYAAQQLEQQASQQAAQQANAPAPEAVAPAAPVDPLAGRLQTLTQSVRAQGTLDALRQPDAPADAKQFIRDLAIAKSQSTLPAQREQALGRLEYASAWADANPAPLVASGIEQNVEDKPTSLTDAPAARAPVPVATAQSLLRQNRLSDEDRRSVIGSLSMLQNPALSPGLRDAAQTVLNEVIGRNAAPVAPAAPATAASTAPAATVTPGTPALFAPRSAAIGSSEEALARARREEDSAGQLRAMGRGDLAQGHDDQASLLRDEAAERQRTAIIPIAGNAQPAKVDATSAGNITTPRVAIPAGEGSAQLRKRRAVLAKVIADGMGTVERRNDGQFFLVDGTRKRQFKLDGPVDAQLARKAVQDAQAAATAAASQPVAATPSAATPLATGVTNGPARPDPQSTTTTGPAATGLDIAAGVAAAGPATRGVDAGRPVSGAGSVVAADGGGQAAAATGTQPSHVTVQVKGQPYRVELVNELAANDASPVRESGSRRINQANAATLQKLAGLLGKKVQFFRDENLGDGFVDPATPGTVYLNERSSINPLAVFGHEFLHQLRQSMPAVHASLMKVVQAKLKKDGAHKFRNDYYRADAGPNPNGALQDAELEEITSDIGGNFMSDVGFWADVFAQVQQDDPATSKSALAQLAARIYRQIDKLIDSIKQSGFGSTALVNDLKTVRAAFKGALAQYVAANNLSQAGMQAEVLKVTQKEVQASTARVKDQSDLFPGEFAGKRATVTRERVVSSKGATEKVKLGNINSAGQQVTATHQGLENFWNWFDDSAVVDGDGRPMLLFHSTNTDVRTLKAGQKTSNNYGLMGDLETTRSAIFATANKDFSQEYLRDGAGQNVMPIYMLLQQPFDTSNGLSAAMVSKLKAEGIYDQWYDSRHDWELYDNDSDGLNTFVDKLKALGYDGAIFNEEDENGDEQTTFAAFESSQIKSALGNNGVFGRSNPDITQSAARSPVAGIHFSAQQRTELDGRQYGSGMKGQELERLNNSTDPRLLARTYAYIDEGQGVTPETGVGSVPHEVQLPWLYDARVNDKKIWNGGDLNATESAILDAGYSGYYVSGQDGRQGTAVVMGEASHALTARPLAEAKVGAPSAVPVPLSRSLMSRELNAVEPSNIPGATLKNGTLSVPLASREAANDEMARIQSSLRFSPVRELDALPSAYASTRAQLHGTPGWLQAPNGQATKLTERQWVHVRTPAFKAWFGNWEKFASQAGGVWSDDKGSVSKAVGLDGEPLVIYHGTDDGGFAEFRKPGGTKRGDLGIFTTSNEEMARSYVKRGTGARITGVDDTGRKVSGIYASFLNLRTPSEADFEGANWSGSRAEQFTLEDENGEQLYAPNGQTYFRDDALDQELARLDKADVSARAMPADDHYESTDSVVREARRDRNDGAIIRQVMDDGGGRGSYSGEPSDVFVAFDPNQLKSADFNDGSYRVDTDDIRLSPGRSDITQTAQRSDPMEASTRAPWAKIPGEDALQDLLLVGLDSSKAGRKAFERNVTLVTAYPNYRETPSAHTPDKQAERFIEHAKSNLLWLYDQVPPAVRERSHQWYDGAERITNRWAPQFRVTPAQVAGVMAVLSPQKDWFMNVDLARRVLDTVQNQAGHAWTGTMTRTVERIYDKPQYAEAVADITGKTLADLTNNRLRAMWVRAYDQTYNSRYYDLLSPEGDVLGLVTNQNGASGNVAWGDFGSIGKAIEIIDNGSLKNISAQLGNEHKVRNFYNNILVPNSLNGHVTIDTHAVAAALLRPLAGSALEVLHNFGGSGAASNAAQGSSGTYGLYVEAYRRAAIERGVLARQMQSITWEAVRGLFTAGFKAQQKNVDAVQAIWENHQKGKASLDNTRQLILDASGGIESPSWLRFSPGLPLEQRSSDAPAVPGVQLSGRGAQPDAGRAGGEPTPAAAEPPTPDRGEQAAASPGAQPVPRPGGVRGGAGLLAGTRRPYQGDGRQGSSLEGLPKTITVDGAPVVFAGFKPAQDAAAAYMAEAGLDYTPPTVYTPVDPARARRIAEAFESAADQPNDPEVKAAYQAMIQETIDQYEAILKTGLVAEFNDGGDPYGNPRNAILDVVENNHLFIFSTRDGFGSGTFDASSSPMLAPTIYEFAGQPALANDIFRVVHDYFGHVKEGVGFRADGEENAWRSHVAMYSPLARRAVTMETRGQNSYVNYGPHEAFNRTANGGDTIYADQKVGLLPEWVSEEGARDPVSQAPEKTSGTNDKQNVSSAAPTVRPEALIALRKRQSVLESLKKCLG